MNDQFQNNELGILEPEWKRAWHKLRNDGLSDSEIWDLVASVEDEDWPEDPLPDQEKRHYYAELINMILDLRNKSLSEDHPPDEWILDGMRLVYTLSLAGNADQAKEFLSTHQKKNQSRTRNRRGRADDIVDYVLGKLPADERGMTGFREFVIRHTTMELESAKFDVTPLEDSGGEITHYVFENRSIDEDDTSARVEVPLSTVRSSIHRYPIRMARRSKKQSIDNES